MYITLKVVSSLYQKTDLCLFSNNKKTTDQGSDQNRSLWYHNYFKIDTKNIKNVSINTIQSSIESVNRYFDI